MVGWINRGWATFDLGYEVFAGRNINQIIELSLLLTIKSPFL